MRKANQMNNPYQRNQNNSIPNQRSFNNNNFNSNHNHYPPNDRFARNRNYNGYQRSNSNDININNNTNMNTNNANRNRNGFQRASSNDFSNRNNGHRNHNENVYDRNIANHNYNRNENGNDNRNKNGNVPMAAGPLDSLPKEVANRLPFGNAKPPKRAKPTSFKNAGATFNNNRNRGTKRRYNDMNNNDNIQMTESMTTEKKVEIKLVGTILDYIEIDKQALKAKGNEIYENKNCVPLLELIKRDNKYNDIPKQFRKPYFLPFYSKLPRIIHETVDDNFEMKLNGDKVKEKGEMDVDNVDEEKDSSDCNREAE